MTRYAFLAIFISTLFIASCQKQNDNNGQTNMQSASPGAPNPAPPPFPPDSLRAEESTSKHSAADAYESTKQTWDRLRSNEQNNIGKTVHLERLRITSINDFENYILACTSFPANYVRIKLNITSKHLHEHDWIDVTGVFTGVDKDGDVEIKQKSIDNLGIHPFDW